MTTRFATIDLRDKNNLLTQLKDIDCTDSIKEVVEAHTRHIGRYSVSIKPITDNKTTLLVYGPNYGGLWAKLKHLFASLRMDLIISLDIDHQTGGVSIKQLKENHLMHLVVAFEVHNLNHRC